MRSPKKLLRFVRQPRQRLLKLVRRLRKQGLKAWDQRLFELDLQTHGKSLLRDFYEASSAVGIRPFLMWGTLLGCVRERRLLNNDSDIDLGIIWSDYDKKEALVAAMQKRGYRVAMDKAYKLKFARPFSRLLIDVDVFYPWDGKMISCVCQEDGSWAGSFFHQNAFDRVREMTFLGDLKVLIPDPPTTVLATIYGDWRVPNRRYRSSRDLLNRLRIPPDEPTPRFPTKGPDETHMKQHEQHPRPSKVRSRM